MPKFLCSYAYDVSCYADFTVEAPDEAAAQALIDQALADRKFDNVDADPCWNAGTNNHRVFVASGPDADSACGETLEELIAQ
jgi:hypothetical protein